ncbi:Acyl CoA binding protein, partial [Rhizoctonia solani]
MLTSSSTPTLDSNQAASMDIDSLINAQFNRAVEIVQSLPKTGPIQTGYEEKLAMYSLYKQATQGNVKTSRPGVWDMLGRAKWDEWAKHKDMDTREAQWRYVLRKYPDRTIARDLIAELDSFAGDPNNLVMSTHSNMGASTSLHDRAETSSSGSSRTEGSPPPVHAALLEAQKQHFAHVQRPADTGVFESSEDDEETESDTDEEIENAAHPPHPQPQPQSQSQQANSPQIVRPRSSLSSQYQYRTPAAPSNINYSPTHSHAEQGPTPVMAGIPLTQPQPRYAAPSAFAPLSQQGSALAFSPQQPTLSLHPAYHPHVPPSEAMASYRGHPHPTYQDAPRSRSPPRGTSMGLERAIIDIQASLSALRERMETIEQGGSFTSSYSSRHRQSPPRRHSPLHPMLPFNIDPRSFGAWSVILTPLARSVVSTRQMLQVVRRNPTMIIIRRLMLDISFLLALLAVIRACWRRFGGRRHEVISALGGIWVALVNGGKASARRERILVDRGI